MADLPAWLRIPDEFASSGDPVDRNPFRPDDARHRVWQDATKRAEEECARVNSRWMSALSPENSNQWLPTLLAAQFSVWAQRGVHVLWSDAAVAGYDEWLVRYSNAILKDLSDLFGWRAPFSSVAPSINGPMRSSQRSCGRTWP